MHHSPFRQWFDDLSGRLATAASTSPIGAHPDTGQPFGPQHHIRRTIQYRIEARLLIVRELEHLRALNARATAGSATAAPAPPSERITLRTGRRDAPGIDIVTSSDAEPIVVETILMRPKGKSVSQNVQVTRRGSKPIAIVKPRAREWNVSDIVDEEELKQQLLEEYDVE